MTSGSRIDVAALTAEQRKDSATQYKKDRRLALVGQGLIRS